MANVLNKTTAPADYRTSVNTADYDPADWFINPDVSAVAGVPTKYWTQPLTDPVTEMDQAAKDVVDAAEDTARKDAIADELDRTQTIMRAFAEAVVDEINILRANDGLNARTLAQLKTAVRNKL